jgi:hypothetical protein
MSIAALAFFRVAKKPLLPLFPERRHLSKRLNSMMKRFVCFSSGVRDVIVFSFEFVLGRHGS